MRARLDEMKDSLGLFHEQSLSVLRRAVYTVRPFAKDWPRLQTVWREYESCHQSDPSRTESFAKIQELEGGKPFATRLHDYLNQMDDYVAS